MGTRKIIDSLTMRLPDYVPAEAKQSFYQLRASGWRFYVVYQRRGWCKFQEKTIAIPEWIFKRKEGKPYIEWYIAHEIAHAICPDLKDSIAHGPIFMKTLKGLCNPKAWIYETTYKTKQAVASGLGCFDF